MNGNMISTTIVRQRGQLTIPKKLRDRASWFTEGSVVAILTSMQREIKVVPYREAGVKLDWKGIWEKIELVRTFKGERGNLSGFIVKDRFLH